MTSRTGCGNSLESSIGMALLTVNICVSARQGETGAAMVKICRFPIGCVMAGLTIVSIFAIMDIILFMTGIAVPRRGLKISQGTRIKMALCTWDFSVFSVKIE